MFPLSETLLKPSPPPLLPTSQPPLPLLSFSSSPLSFLPVFLPSPFPFSSSLPSSSFLLPSLPSSPLLSPPLLLLPSLPPLSFLVFCVPSSPTEFCSHPLPLPQGRTWCGRMFSTQAAGYWRENSWFSLHLPEGSPQGQGTQGKGGREVRPELPDVLILNYWTPLLLLSPPQMLGIKRRDSTIPPLPQRYFAWL